MTLTDKQRRFVDEYLVDLCAAKAAIRAGYSEKTADRIGHQLINKPAIAEAIAVAQASRSERTQVDADWLLRRLADEAEADVADLYDDSGSLKPVHEWPLIWRKGLVAGLDVEEVTSEGVVIGIIRKLKLSDRIKRLELIGKHIGVQAFREQVGLSNPDGGPVELKVIEDAERFTSAIAGLAARGREGSGS